MLKKINCWEFKNCGREEGGVITDKFGVCPAAQSMEFDEVNGGVSGGRFCWGIDGTVCHGELQGNRIEKLKDCLECDFLKNVNQEEGRDFKLTPKQCSEKTILI